MSTNTQGNRVRRGPLLLAATPTCKYFFVAAINCGLSCTSPALPFGCSSGGGGFCKCNAALPADPHPRPSISYQREYTGRTGLQGTIFYNATLCAMHAFFDLTCAVRCCAVPCGLIRAGYYRATEPLCYVLSSLGVWCAVRCAVLRACHRLSHDRPQTHDAPWSCKQGRQKQEVSEWCTAFKTDTH
jgi:hypothetical protein